MLDNKQRVVLALGYFDCIHIGHRKVIERAKALANQLNAKTVVFTFDGNLRKALKGENQKCVYLLSERKQILKEMGIDQIFLAPTTAEFLSLSKREFLDTLNKEYTILGYCSGNDYRFGAKGQGDVEYLSKYAKENNQFLEVIETFLFEGQKVSTTLIKEYLTAGDIEKANALLGREYSVNGRVIKDRGLGKKLGFPTANIKVGQEKHPLKNGVYSGKVYVDGKKYRAVINFGARPTFSLKEVLLEAHLIDFNGDLYDRELTVYLDRFLREVKTFNNVNDLKDQIAKDVEKVRNFND